MFVGEWACAAILCRCLCRCRSVAATSSEAASAETLAVDDRRRNSDDNNDHYPVRVSCGGRICAHDDCRSLLSAHNSTCSEPTISWRSFNRDPPPTAAGPRSGVRCVQRFCARSSPAIRRDACKKSRAVVFIICCPFNTRRRIKLERQERRRLVRPRHGRRVESAAVVDRCRVARTRRDQTVHAFTHDGEIIQSRELDR